MKEDDNLFHQDHTQSQTAGDEEKEISQHKEEVAENKEQGPSETQFSEGSHFGSSLRPDEHQSDIQSAMFSDFDDSQDGVSPNQNLDMLFDIPLQITVELGRTKRTIKDILQMSPGSVIELDKLAGEPVDIYANNKMIAKGEVVVIDENFGVRITEIVSQSARMQKLQ